MNIRFQKKIIAACIALALTGCGGDSSTEESGNSAVPSTTQVVSAVGEIDGFGSVIVNGVHYETDDAVFTIDGKPATEDDLEVGQIVELIGEIDESGKAHAKKVFMRTRIGGQISAVDVAARTISVMDYTVQITDDTKLAEGINEATLEGLAEGVYVKVHGFSGDDGTVIASRIGLKKEMQSPEEMKLNNHLFGKVESIDTTEKTLVVDGKTVDFNSAELAGDVDALVAGVSIMARGTFAEEVLVADHMVVITAALKEDGEEVEQPSATNPIKTEVSGNLEFDGEDFTLNGKKLKGIEDADFLRGSLEEILAGKKIEIEGTEIDGEIDVDNVKVERVSRLSIVAALETIDTEASTVTLGGTTILITEDTDFEDASDIEERHFDIADLITGDKLMVKAYETEEGVYVANRVKRLGDNDSTFINHIGRVEVTIASATEDMLVTTDGLEIAIDESTLLAEGVDLANLALGAEGTRLYVSGVYETENKLVAKFIIVAMDDEFFDGKESGFNGAYEFVSNGSASGQLSAVDVEAGTITIGDLVLNVSADTKIKTKIKTKGTDSDLVLADLMAGDRVSVRYTKDEEDNATAEVITKIRAIEKLESSEGDIDIASVKVTIASVTQDMLVTTDGLEVSFDEYTFVGKNVDLANLVLGEEGTELYISGVYETENKLAANYILAGEAKEFFDEKEGDFEEDRQFISKGFTSGELLAVNSDAETVTMGELVLNISADTKIKTKGSESELALTDLMVGDYVGIHYSEDEEGIATAEVITKKTESDETMDILEDTDITVNVK